MDFADPIVVSSMPDPDQVIIRFIGNQFFFDRFGSTINANKTLTAKIPK